MFQSKLNMIIMILVFLLSGQWSSAVEEGPMDFLKSLSEELAKSTGDLVEVKKGITIKGSLENIPLGEPKGGIPPECNPHEFESQSLLNYQNAKMFSQFAKKYFDQCSKYLTKGNLKGLMGLVKFSTIKYDLSKNPQIKAHMLTLSDGSKLEAFIGVKDLETQRPWVILKCGVFCDITNSASMSNFVINFFDQSPFNILFVSNYTGSKYIQENSSLRMGGFFEVYDFYDIAHWLKNESPYRETVDSIHAVGVSLGGSAALGVGFLENLYKSKDGMPLFSSTSAICPVVNLGPTLKDMYANSTKGKIFTALTWKYLKDAAPYLDNAHDYLDAKLPPKSELFPPMLIDIVLRYGDEWEKSNPPGRLASILENADEYLRKNHFSDENNFSLKVPTLAWASTDDNVVNFKLNTNTLINLSKASNNLGAFGVEYGDHCGFDTAYGYGATTSILQSFIINNSPKFKERENFKLVTLNNSLRKLNDKEVHLRQWWLAKENSSLVTLFFETFDPSKSFSCRFKKPFNSDNGCHNHYSLSIPLNTFQLLGMTTPNNTTESQILTRKLNGLVRVTNSTRPIDGTQLSPTHLLWRDF